VNNIKKANYSVSAAQIYCETVSLYRTVHLLPPSDFY